MTTNDDILNMGESGWDITQFSLLNPNKFKVVINLFQDTAFWAQSVEIPSITMGANKMNTSTSLKWWVPGDTIEYDDLHIEFMVDRDLLAYRILKQWQENCVNSQQPSAALLSDMQIVFLTNNSNANISFSFKNAFPQLLSGIKMGTKETADAPLTVDVTFKFTNFVLSPLVAPDPATP